MTSPPGQPATAPAAPSEHEPSDYPLIRAQALGFSVGSLLFMVGAAMAQWTPAEIDKTNAVFVAGALCFTGAAALQLLLAGIHQRADEKATAEQAALTGNGEQKFVVRHLSVFRNPDWVASVIQLIGTLYFNVMTIHAFLYPVVSPTQGNQLVWRPDLLGSVMFLVSSAVAWFPTARRRRHSHVAWRSLWICRTNLLGSIAFGVSVLGSRYMASGEIRNTAEANIATLIGGFFFLVGSLLLFPWWDRRDGRASNPNSNG